MARIYVSSTFGDLRDHREKVYRALRQLGHDVLAMEDYVATDQRPLAKCLEDVAACDLYVGIFAHRNGYYARSQVLFRPFLHHRQQLPPRFMTKSRISNSCLL